MWLFNAGVSQTGRLLVFLFLLFSVVVEASLCPKLDHSKDLRALDECSKGNKSIEEWGECLHCKGVCENLADFTDLCVLAYGQILSSAASRECTLGSSVCNTAFSEILNATCTVANANTEPCSSSLKLIPIIAGSVGGFILIVVVITIIWDCRRRMAKRERELRRQKRENRKAREAASNGNMPSTKQKWRPSFMRRVDNELSPMSSAMIPSQGSFRGPPPGAPPPIPSHGSFRGPPPGLASHGSFRAPPPAAPPTIPSHGSFRAPPPQAPPPGLASHNSFHGMPTQMQQPVLTSHHSFHGMPAMPPGVGAPPPPPPSRNSGAIMPGGGGAPPPVPPSRNSGAITSPTPAPTAPAPVANGDSGGASSSGGGGGGTNDLLEQIRRGKQLKKTQPSDSDKPADKVEEKKPAPSGGGGAGGLMAELQKKMKMKQQSGGG